MSCKTSKDCSTDQVCDKKHCRANKLKKNTEYYIELCKKKNIPLVFEAGKRTGQPKTREALQRCVRQKSRTKTPIPKEYAKSASKRLILTCKTSRNCPDNQVCENHKCRENRRDKPIEYYIDICKKKNIPVVYENGDKKGKIKPVAALKRCMNQKPRKKTHVSVKARTV